MDDAQVQAQIKELRRQIEEIRRAQSDLTSTYYLKSGKISGTFTLAKLTAGGVNGSITIKSGEVTDFVAAT